MRGVRRLSRVRSVSTTILIATVVFSIAQAAQRETARKTRIKNFGSVNDKFYRGAQPQVQDYYDLAAMGIKTVIDLQREGVSGEQRLVEAAGMKFFRIPMSDRSRPSSAAAEQFLSLVQDPTNQPVFIHCRGGRHRTGAMTAVFRLACDGWTAERAVAEMKQYDFDRGFGHGVLKDYVYDYYSQMDQKGVVVNSSK